MAVVAGGGPVTGDRWIQGDDYVTSVSKNPFLIMESAFHTQKNVTGANLLSLTKDEIMDLTGMKVGPSLKIENLITQLKIKVNPAHERMKQAGLKKLL